MSDKPFCCCGKPAALKKVTDRFKPTYGRCNTGKRCTTQGEHALRAPCRAACKRYRFWGCKGFNENRMPCRFFQWYEADEPELGKVSADLQKGEDGQYSCQLCGKNLMFGAEHKCRLYGTYQCGFCGNRWTSGYSWSGEQQQCRICGMYQEPETCQQLQRNGSSRGGSRPHDSSKCSLCQQLGYPCSAAAHPGAPGFVRQAYSQGYLQYSGSRYRPY